MTEFLMPWLEGHLRLTERKDRLIIELLSVKVEIEKDKIRVFGAVSKESTYSNSLKRVFLSLTSPALGLRASGVPQELQDLRTKSFTVMLTKIAGSSYVTIVPRGSSRLAYVVISPRKIMVVARGEILISRDDAALTIRIV